MKYFLLFALVFSALSLVSCEKSSENISPDTEKVSFLTIPDSYTGAVETAPITVDGQEITLVSNRLTLGDTLKDIPLDHKADYFNEVNTGSISQYAGYKVIETVPSLDTPVCTMQTKQLEEAAEKFPEIPFFVISNDTPFALQRFCAANGIENVHVLSDARTRDFGTQNGLFMPEFGLLARSIMIVNDKLEIVYIDYAEEVTDELDLGNALAFLISRISQ